MTIKTVFSALCVACAATSAIDDARAQSPVKVGNINCVVSGTNKSLISAQIVLDCVFTGLENSATRRYQGTIDRKGLSLGSIKTNKISWIVLTLGDPKNIKLDGTYLGATAGVSAGAGAGANYLTGGFNKKFSLQPYSVEGKKGFGLELGAQSLKLTEIEPAK